MSTDVGPYTAGGERYIQRPVTPDADNLGDALDAPESRQGHAAGNFRLGTDDARMQQPSTGSYRVSVPEGYGCDGA
jgi:hypothetical protein